MYLLSWALWGVSSLCLLYKLPHLALYLQARETFRHKFIVSFYFWFIKAQALLLRSGCDSWKAPLFDAPGTSLPTAALCHSFKGLFVTGRVTLSEEIRQSVLFAKKRQLNLLYFMFSWPSLLRLTSAQLSFISLCLPRLFYLPCGRKHGAAPMLLESVFGCVPGQ